MKFIPLFVLCWVSYAAAQTFHISPSNPILVGDPLSIEVDGLRADQNVTLTAQRTMEATNRGGEPVLYRSQAVFPAPQGALDLATAKPLSGTYSDADIRGLFWSMAPVDGGELDGLQPLVSVRESSRPGFTEFHLVAGPVANADAAARLCAALSSARVPCQPATFDGQRMPVRSAPTDQGVVRTCTAPAAG